MQTLMDVATLKDRLDDAGTTGRRTVLLDVRWALGDSHGREHYLAEHLPGAVFVDLATELAGPADASRGRHPLPSMEQFQASARSWGIHSGDFVVAYDDSGNLAAARLWWMLRTPALATFTCSTAAWPPGAARATPSKAANGGPNRGTLSWPTAPCR